MNFIFLWQKQYFKFISSRHRVISSIYITVYKFYKCGMHFPSLCAVSWWFHTVTEMSFILVGPGMPFSFHQSQYRLLIVTDSISLSIWSLNLKQISFKISEKPSCHLLLPSKLPQHLSQDSPETLQQWANPVGSNAGIPLIGLDYFVCHWRCLFGPESLKRV